MKTLLIRKSGIVTSLLAANVLAGVSFFPNAEAGVVWLASDDGTNLTLTTSGSLNTSASFDTFSNPNAGYSPEFSFLLAPVNDNSPADFGAGTSSFYPGNLDAIASTTTGHSFGTSGANLLWDQSFGLSPGTFAPVTTIIFNGETVASAFGSSLDAGHVVLWTDSVTRDTVSIGLTSVPEPSSTGLVGFGGVALLLRRRRQAYIQTITF